MFVKRIVLFLIFCVLALCVAGVFFLMTSPVRYSLPHVAVLLRAPEIVQNMVFVTNSEGGSALTRIERGGLRVQEFPRKHIREVIVSPDKTLLLIIQTGSDAVDIVEVQNNTVVPITTDGSEKGSIALSTDGRFFAFVRPKNDTLDSYSPSRYEITVQDSNGEDVKTFTGNHPHFLDAETLVFFSERGIETYNLKNGNSAYGPVHDPSFHTSARPFFGNNRIFLTLEPETNLWRVYEYAPDTPIFYSFYGTLPQVSGGFAVTDGDAVYHGGVSEGVFSIKKITGIEHTPETIFSIDAAYFAPDKAFFAL